MNPQILNRARELLLSLTPLNHDCGMLCGQACCAPDEEGQGGMMLFPGESALYRECVLGRSGNRPHARRRLCLLKMRWPLSPRSTAVGLPYLSAQPLF